MDVQSLKLNDYLVKLKKVICLIYQWNNWKMLDKIDELYNRYPRKIRFRIDCNRKVSQEEVSFKLSWKIIQSPAVTELI